MSERFDVKLIAAKQDNPYAKPYHMAKLIRADGRVSPLCANPPRALDLKRGLWTLGQSAVTCPRCLKALAILASKPEPGR